MILKQLNAFLLIQPFGHTFAHCLQSCNFARPRRVYLHTYLWDGISVTRFGEISQNFTSPQQLVGGLFLKFVTLHMV